MKTAVPDYGYQLDFIKRLPRGCRISVIGKSLCGRNIFCIRTGRVRGVPLIAAGFHGMEYLTVSAALRFAAEFAAEPHSGGLITVPCVNPDGVEISLHGAKAACSFEPFVKSTGMESRWQANAHGVDINHNFAADWRNVKRRELAAGITEPGATRFGGYRPESEPETQALIRLCGKACPSRVLALHSQGREIYRDFGSRTPEGCCPLAERMAKAGGYSVAEPEPIATGGGFKDWFIAEYGRCGFTVEMGMGKNPLPLSDFDAEYPRVRDILRAFLAG